LDGYIPLKSRDSQGLKSSWGCWGHGIKRLPVYPSAKIHQQEIELRKPGPHWHSKPRGTLGILKIPTMANLGYPNQGKVNIQPDINIK